MKEEKIEEKGKKDRAKAGKGIIILEGFKTSAISGQEGIRDKKNVL